MDGDKDEIQTLSTPRSTDSLSSATEIESDWSKLKSEFQDLPPDRLYLIPTSLPSLEDAGFSDLRTAAIDDSFNLSIPHFFLAKSEQVCETKHTVRCVSFLHEARSNLNLSPTETDNDFVICVHNQISLYHMSADATGLFLTGKFIDESETEKFMVARFIVGEGQQRQVMVAAGGRDGVVKLFSLTNVQLSYGLMGHRHTIRDLRPMDDSDFLFSCSDDLSIRLWNIRTRVQVALFQGILAHTDSIRALDIHHSQDFLVSGGMDRCVQLWSLDEKVKSAKALSKVWVSDFTLNNGIRCSRKRFETKLVTQAVFFTFKVHEAGVCAVRFYHNLIISQDKNNRVCVWQPNPNRAACSIILIHSIQLKPWIKTVFGFSASRHFLAGSGDAGEVLIWNLLNVTYAPLAVKKLPSLPIKGLCFSASGSTLIGICKGGVIMRLEALE